MAGGRVVVPDLAPPERIRPYGIQSDTFERPAEPPINNDYERLASALGQFSSAAMGAARRLEADAERQRKEAEAKASADATAKFLRWEMETDDAVELQAYETGTAPVTLVKEHVLKTHKANAYGRAFAKSVGDKIAAGSIPGWGTAGFNVDTFVMEEARPYLDAIDGDPTQLDTFQNHFDQVGGAAREAHGKLLLGKQEEAMDTAALDAMSAAFENSVNSQLLSDSIIGPSRGDLLQAMNRQLYGELGPGSLVNRSHARLDELQLEMLQRHAKDPRYAQYVMQMLGEERYAIDGSGMKLGSFLSSKKHSGTAGAIFETARQTMAEDYKKQVEASLKIQDAYAFDKGDGSHNMLKDHVEPNIYDEGKPIEVSAERRKKEAAENWLAAYRASNGGLPDYTVEVEKFALNNVKHPDLAGELTGAFRGAITAQGSGSSPDVLQRAVDAYEKYSVASAMGYNYVEGTLLDQETIRYYEAVRYGVEHMKLTTEAATANALRLWATPEGRDQPHFSPDLMATIDANAASVSKWGFLNDETNANPHEVRGRIMRLAMLYTQMGNTPDNAVTLATERVNEQSLFINGRRTWGLNGLVKGDGEIVTGLLKDIYRDQSSAAMKAAGIESPNDMRLAQGARGQYLIVNENGEPVIGNGGRPLTITREDVRQRRATVDAIHKAKAKAEFDHSRASAEQARQDQAKSLSGRAPAAPRKSFQEMNRNTPQASRLPPPAQPPAPPKPGHFASGLGRTVEHPNLRKR
jgi:hypothetical protein